MTNKEMILKQREAYITGAYIHCESGCKIEKIEKEAAEKYPIPKITRPREIELLASNGVLVRFRIEKGILKFNQNITTKKCCSGFWYGAHYANKFKALIEDLLANPTEEVEDDS